LARYNIIAAAFGFVALALVAMNARKRAAPAALAGVVLALAFEVHPLAAVYGPAILALYLVRSGPSCLREGDFWVFGLSAAGGLCGYALLHIVRYPATYYALSRLVYGPTHTPPIASLDIRLLAFGFLDTGQLLWKFLSFGALLALWALARLGRSSAPGDRTLVVTTVAVILAVSLFMRTKIVYYAILISPAIALVLARFISESFDSWRTRSTKSQHALVAGAGLLVASIVLTLPDILHDGTGQYRSVQKRIDDSILPHESIMGAQTYWFGLYDHRYVSWEQLVYFRRYAPGSTLADEMREFKPDIFIEDGHIRQFIGDAEGASPYFQGLRLPRKELARLLSEQGTLVTSFDGGSYGWIKIYRLQWPAGLR
jgi:hypothetical protein